jgi:hypothetical protein
MVNLKRVFFNDPHGRGRRMYGASDGALSLPKYLPPCNTAILVAMLPEIATKSENDKILQTKVGEMKGRGGK